MNTRRCSWVRILHLTVTLALLLSYIGPAAPPARAAAPASPAAASVAGLDLHGLPLNLPAALVRQGLRLTGRVGNWLGRDEHVW